MQPDFDLTLEAPAESNFQACQQYEHGLCFSTRTALGPQNARIASQHSIRADTLVTHPI